MYYLQKRSNGTYYARGTHPQTNAAVLRSLRTSNKRIAHKKCEKLYMQHLEDETNLTWEQAYKEYQFVRGDCYFCERLCRYIGQMPLSSVDQKLIREICEKHYDKCITSSLITSVYSPIRKIIRFSLQAHPHLKYNRIEIPRDKRPLVLRVPNDQWFDQFLGTVPLDLKCLCLLLTTTGLRLSEALSLTRAAINFETGEVGVTVKGGGVRSVRLPPLLLDYARMKTPPHAPLFEQSQTLLRRRLRSHCKRFRLEQFTFHEIGRHAFAARLLNKGYPLKFVQQAGGWASMGVLDRYYGHLEASHVRDAVSETMDEFVARR